MHAHLKRRLIAAVIVLTPLAAPSIWVARQYRQVNLNRALIAAIKHEDADAVDHLLAAGADPNTRDTPERNPSIVQRFHDLFHPPPPELSQTVLLLAITADTDNNTLLFTKTTAIVKMLLAKGANPDAIGYLNCYPSRAGYIILSHVRLETRPPLGTPLLAACIYRKPSIIRLLLDHGANIQQTGQFGEAPLISAILSGESTSVRILLDRGASPSVGGNADFGNPYEYGSPLLVAQRSGLTGIARLLKSYGAKE